MILERERTISIDEESALPDFVALHKKTFIKTLKILIRNTCLTAERSREIHSITMPIATCIIFDSPIIAQTLNYARTSRTYKVTIVLRKYGIRYRLPPSCNFHYIYWR